MKEDNELKRQNMDTHWERRNVQVKCAFGIQDRKTRENAGEWRKKNIICKVNIPGKTIITGCVCLVALFLYFAYHSSSFYYYYYRHFFLLSFACCYELTTTIIICFDFFSSLWKFRLKWAASDQAPFSIFSNVKYRIVMRSELNG